MVRIPGPGEIPNVRPARDPGIRNASANAFGRLEAVASAEQGRALEGLGSAVADYANALLESRQEAEDASFLAAYTASERVQASRALNKLQTDEEGIAAGVAEQFVGTWNDGVDNRIDIVRRETGLTPSEGALHRARNISLALGGVFGARAVQNEHTARIALYGQTLDNGIEQLGSQVFEDPTQLDDVLIEADAMLTGAATFLPVEEVDRLRAEVPPRLVETYYRGRLAQGDAAGVLADLEQQQDDLPAAVAADLTRSAEQQLEIDRHRTVVAAEADRIVAAAREGTALAADRPADTSAIQAALGDDEAAASWHETARAEAEHIADPVVRADVEAEIDRRWAADQQAARDRREQAQQAAWEHILSGGTVAGIPAATLREAGPAALDSLQRHERQNGAVRTDYGAFERLARMPIEALAQVSPLEYRGHLAPAEYGQIEAWVADARNRGAGGEASSLSGRPPGSPLEGPLAQRQRVDTVLDKLGWTALGNRWRTGWVRSQMGQALQAAEQRNGGPLGDEEQNRVIDQSLTAIADQTRRGFDVEQWLGPAIAAEEVPADHAETIRGVFLELFGQDPTEQELVEFYLRGLIVGRSEGAR